MKYLALGSLFFYGFFYHITSSEFWPVTISKTWLNRAVFEDSMLQKPLLTLFLAFFHLLPLSDAQHVYLVKFVFTCLGVAGLVFYSLFLMRITNQKSSHFSKATCLAWFLALLSPLLLTNFFSIRSDQVAFFLFSVFLFFSEKKWLRTALISLLLIPLCGIKEILFLIPGGIYFFWNFKNDFTKKNIFFTVYSSIMVLVWVLALNVRSAFYLASTYSGGDYHLRFGLTGFQVEFPLLVLSLLASLYIFISKKTQFYKLAITSFLFFGLLLSLPQAYPFFIASVIAFIYLPLIALFISVKLPKPLKIGLLSAQFVYLICFYSYYKFPLYFSNFDQLQFIKTASTLIKENNFTYLDGEGSMPRQNFYPCFISPYDDDANNGCIHQLADSKPDALIITNRLAFIGDSIFIKAKKEYIQIKPNFWIRKEKVTDKISSQIDLSDKNPIPVLIF